MFIYILKYKETSKLANEKCLEYYIIYKNVSYKEIIIN